MTNYSKNLLTGQHIAIPNPLNDQSNIDLFLEKHPGKKVIVVQGLGFVGSVMSLVCANALTEEYAVIGIDLPTPNAYWKIAAINGGEFPVTSADPKIELFYQESRKKQNLYATYDPYAFSKADIIIVDINLDVQKEFGHARELKGFDVDLTAFRKGMEAIGKHCKPNALILVETTVPPGTCEKVVLPTITKCLEERKLPIDQIHIGHSYERVMPGPKYVDSIQNFYRVYSGINEMSADATEKFLRTIISTEEFPLTRLNNTNATEMAKVLENSFRAMNIAFMVEWSRFAEEAGVDIYEVVQAIRLRPTHKNIMLPGLGVGGYCLTKDPLMASWARKNLFEGGGGLIQSEMGVRINDQMPLYAFQFFKEKVQIPLQDLQILFCGVSYLNDIGDTRYTPVEGIYDAFINEGSHVTLHDPHIPYWFEREVNVFAQFEDLFNKSYSIIVITTGHKEYRNNPEFVQHLMNQKPCIIYDTIGVFTNGEISNLQQKHRVLVIGRGDL